MDLLSFLQNQGVITPEVQTSVEQKLAAGEGDLETLLLAAGIEKDTLRASIAAYYEIPAYVPPEENERVAPDVLEYIPVESAQHYQVIPLKLEDNVLLVGVNDPEDLKAFNKDGYRYDENLSSGDEWVFTR